MLNQADFEECAEPAVRIAKHLAKNKIEFVVVPGFGAQTFAYMIKIALKEHPEIKMEKMPTFIALGQLSKNNDTRIRYRKPNEMQALITSKAQKHLPKMRGGKVCILEDCYHSGVTVSIIENALKKMGAREVHLGVLNAENISKMPFRGPKAVGREQSNCPNFRWERKYWCGYGKKYERKLALFKLRKIRQDSANAVRANIQITKNARNSANAVRAKFQKHH